MKICKMCLKEKELIDFNIRKTKKGTIYYRSKCKECESNYNKVYYKNNKDKIKKMVNDFRLSNTKIIKNRKISYYKKNKDIINNRCKIYYHNNKKDISQKKSIYYEKYKDRINKVKLNYQKRKELLDPKFKLRRRISNMIFNALKENNNIKNNLSILQFLPYTIEELKNHIEIHFESWMTWDNWSKYNRKLWDDNNPSTWTWQIDHIIPQSVLPYTNMKEENFKKCWSLNNLRPLSAKQNILDGSNRIRHK